MNYFARKILKKQRSLPAPKLKNKALELVKLRTTVTKVLKLRSHPSSRSILKSTKKEIWLALTRWRAL